MNATSEFNNDKNCQRNSMHRKYVNITGCTYTKYKAFTRLLVKNRRMFENWIEPKISIFSRKITWNYYIKIPKNDGKIRVHICICMEKFIRDLLHIAPRARYILYTIQKYITKLTRETILIWSIILLVFHVRRCCMPDFQIFTKANI